MPGKGNRRANLNSSVSNHRHAPSISNDASTGLEFRLNMMMGEIKIDLLKQSADNHTDMLKTNMNFLKNAEFREEKEAILDSMMNVHQQTMKNIDALSELKVPQVSAQAAPQASTIAEQKVQKAPPAPKKECTVSGCERSAEREADFCRYHKCAKCPKRCHVKHGTMCRECDTK